MRSPSSFSFINWLLRRFRPSAMTEKIAGNGEDVILEGSQAKKPKLSEETTNGTVSGKTTGNSSSSVVFAKFFSVMVDIN